MNGTLYDGLYQFDRNGVPRLDLAAAPPTISADRKVWTFHLRKGVHFSNGMELTADDAGQVQWLQRADNHFENYWLKS
jgi:ABC-type transport system substrate-binding protein